MYATQEENDSVRLNVSSLRPRIQRGKGPTYAFSSMMIQNSLRSFILTHSGALPMHGIRVSTARSNHLPSLKIRMPTSPCSRGAQPQRITPANHKTQRGTPTNHDTPRFRT
eukprot:1066536-Rhodomonas_salina.2